MSESKVKVGVRIRPLASSEIENGAETVVSVERGCAVRVNVPARQNTFDFDWAYGKNSEQRRIYEDTCKPLVDSFFEGYNSTVFAYGQTGSGKTYTMGNDGSQSNEGIIPFAIADIFEKREVLASEGVQMRLELSYMEVYKEECFDLLSPQRQKCEIRESSKGETYVEGLSHHEVSCAEDVRDLLREVAKVRSTAKTAMNAQSSRSHAICTFVLSSSRLLSAEMESGVDTTVTSKSFLHLVDLAGSERAKKTMSTGDVFNEGVNINKGLLALGNVIAALATQSMGGGSSHVPYRDSKITRILKDSLGGNSMTVMLACVSPADTNFEETLNTLRFAARASTIVNSASSNKEYECQEGAGVSATLLQEICVLREEIRKLQARVTGGTNSDALVCLFIKLSEFTKQILIKCLEDDVAIDDSEVEAARETVRSIRLMMSSESCPEGEDEESMSLDFLPPLMKLIEDLETMEKAAAVDLEDNVLSSGRSSDASDSSRSSSSSSRSGTSRGDAAERGDCVGQIDHKQRGSCPDERGHQLSEMSSREAEVTQMIHMSELCKATISQLRREVQELEKEKLAAQAATDKFKMSKGPSSAGESAQSVQMLKEKIKKLEEKQKELRRKEIEYAKLLQQKDKACKEVAALKTELQSSKRMNVEVQKKQRKEAEKYAEERKKLTLQENQSRRREIQAQEKAAKISIELSNKDRVMKSKLEEKEREIKRLKLLSDKQEKAKSQREKAAISRGGAPLISKVVSRTGLPKGGELGKSEVEMLQSWMSKEVDAQSQRIVLREEIKEQTELRAQFFKKITALKSERDLSSTCALVTVANRSDEDVARENEIKNLEREVQRVTVELSHANGRLDNLGHDMDTRRFRNITDLKETKVLLNTLFFKLAHEKVMEKRQLDQRVSAQEHELADLRAKLSQYETQVQPLTVAKKPRLVVESVVGLNGGPQREKIIRKGPTVQKSQRVPGSRIPSGSTKVPLDATVKASASVSNKTNKSSDGEGHEEYDEEDYIDVTFDEDDGLETSDFDDRDESYVDDDDESEYEQTPRLRSRKRTSNESCADSSSSSRKKSRGSSGGDSIESEIAEVSFPLEKYKVPELKKFLADRSLPVGGRKDELISRLTAFLNEEIDENTDTSNVMAQEAEEELVKHRQAAAVVPRKKLLGLKRYNLDNHAEIIDDIA